MPHDTSEDKVMMIYSWRLNDTLYFSLCSAVIALAIFLTSLLPAMAQAKTTAFTPLLHHANSSRNKLYYRHGEYMMKGY